jgi:hypothetical protein
MTRDDDRNGIGTIGGSYRPNGLGLSYQVRNLSVRNRLSIGNPGHLHPDFLLELGSAQVESDIEDPAATLEVLAELPLDTPMIPPGRDGFCSRERASQPRNRCSTWAFSEQNGRESVRSRQNPEWTDGTFHRRLIEKRFHALNVPELGM